MKQAQEAAQKKAAEERRILEEKMRIEKEESARITELAKQA